MKQIRVILKVIALCAGTALIYSAWISAHAFIFAFKNASRRWRCFMFTKWARTTAAIAGMKITVKGPLPQSPFFLVSNHLSYIDIVAFASCVDCVFIARSDVANWPFIGFLCRSVNTIFINRNQRRDIPRVNGLIEEMLSNGQGVVLFPEGTSTQGAKVLPFNSSLLEPAARARYPVSYASISYTTPPGQLPAHLSVCWWDDVTFIKHLLELLRLPKFHATVVFGEETFQDDDRKTLARKLWHAVQNQFTPVVSMEEECSAKIH